MTMSSVRSKLTSRRRSLILAGAIAAAGLATTSFAAPPANVRSVSVRYTDLDLTTAKGADRLYRRIASAAREVCPGVYSPNPGVAADARHCEATAIANAVSKVNNAKLALVHASRTSRG
jgi:UrcA family protein